jgi:hypothetical protein
MPRLPNGEKSSRPRAVRRRLRTGNRTEEEMLEDIETLYQKPVDEWDWEELSRGMPKGPDGKFGGSRPKWITPAIQSEARRRMRIVSEEQLMVHADAAIKTLSQLMADMDVDDVGKPIVPASVKMQAATYILNHTIGTPKARVEIETHSPLMEMMGGVLMNPDGKPSHHVIIEGEVVEDEAEDSDGGE